MIGNYKFISFRELVADSCFSTFRLQFSNLQDLLIIVLTSPPLTVNATVTVLIAENLQEVETIC